MFLYFAYGSNMSRQQMRERCPDHVCLGKAMLPDHGLCFPRSSAIRLCGVAGFEPRAGANVWGVVYRLTAQDLSVLDRREGYDPDKPVHINRYTRRTVPILMNDTTVECFTYVAHPEPGEHRPNAAYLRTIIDGARENGLPGSYIAELRAIVTT